VEKDPQFVVVEVLEPPTGTLDLFGAEVQFFGRSVRGRGAVMVQDLFAPAQHGAGHGADLGNIVVGAGLEGDVEGHGGLVAVVDQIDRGADSLADQAPRTSS
jgi:hypothetical protein